MALLNYPSLVLKGLPFTFTLDKTALAGLVTGDAYFQDQANWSKVVVRFKSATLNQREVLVFNASEATPSYTFEISDKALSDFVVESVMIYDFDNGEHEVKADFSAFSIKMTKHMAPAPVINSFNNGEIGVASSEKIFVGFKVRIYDAVADAYVEGLKTVTAISGNVITCDVPASTAFVSNRYYLRFASLSECHPAQSANFHYVA